MSIIGICRHKGIVDCNVHKNTIRGAFYGGGVGGACNSRVYGYSESVRVSPTMIQPILILPLLHFTTIYCSAIYGNEVHSCHINMVPCWDVAVYVQFYVMVCYQS